MIRWILVSVLVAFVGFIVLISWYLGPDDLRSCPTPDTTSSTCQPFDAIIAVSGGDTSARTAMAVQLYEDGWSSVMIFSGAAQDLNGPSNAAAMKAQAMAAGVPESSIVLDQTSRTTAENAVNTSKLVSDLALKRVVLVTSAYHQRRAYIEFSHQLGSDVTILNHPVPYDNQWSKWWWLTAQGWLLATSEVMKIIIAQTSQGVIR